MKSVFGVVDIIVIYILVFVVISVFLFIIFLIGHLLCMIEQFLCNPLFCVNLPIS